MNWRIGSLKKINKIDKRLASLAKRHSKKIQISKIRDEKRDITTGTEKIQRITKMGFKNLYSTTGENPNETD